MKTYKLNFENYHSSISAGLINFQQNEDFVDMTIAADGHLVNVHRNIISLASPYIREMIKLAPCPHPVVYLSNIKYDILSILLEYIYTGEVEVPDSNFNQLVQAAKELHIVGLTGLMKIDVGSYEQKRTLKEVKKSQSYVPDIQPQIDTVNIAEPLNYESEDAYNANQCYTGAGDSLTNDYMSTQDQNISLDPNNIIHENTCNTEYLQDDNPIPSTDGVHAVVDQPLHITNIETSNLDVFSFNNQFLKFATKNTNATITTHKSISSEQDTSISNQVTENFAAQEPNMQNNEGCNQFDYQLKLKYSGTDSENCTNDGNTENAKEISINLAEIVKSGKDRKAEIILGKPMFALSIRGQLQVIFNRYIYYIIYNSTKGKRRFKCIDYRSKRCQAFIVMQHNIITERKNLHCHEFHDDKIGYKLEKQILYETIEEALEASTDETEKLKQIREIENNNGLDIEMVDLN